MAYLAVVGPGDASPAQIESAEVIGRAVAHGKHVLVCGGLGGVMAAACRGASQAGGVTVGILPGLDRSAGNEWLTVAIATGLGELRNGLVIRAADAVIAVGGAYGTLSEVALALKAGVPVIGVQTWQIEGVEGVDSPEQAVERALRRVAGRTAT